MSLDTVFSVGGRSPLDFITVPGLSTAAPAILLPDRKAPMVPLMRIFLCCRVLVVVTSTPHDSKRGGGSRCWGGGGGGGLSPAHPPSETCSSGLRDCGGCPGSKRHWPTPKKGAGGGVWSAVGRARPPGAAPTSMGPGT